MRKVFVWWCQVSDKAFGTLAYASNILLNDNMEDGNVLASLLFHEDPEIDNLWTMNLLTNCGSSQNKWAFMEYFLVKLTSDQTMKAEFLTLFLHTFQLKLSREYPALINALLPFSVHLLR